MRKLTLFALLIAALAGCTPVRPASPTPTRAALAAVTPAVQAPLPTPLPYLATPLSTGASGWQPATAGPTRTPGPVIPAADTPVPPTPGPTATATPRPAAPATPTAVARPTVAPASGVGRVFELGVPEGDTYNAAAIAVDSLKDRAYVFGTDSSAGSPVVAAVDLTAGRVVSVMPVPGIHRGDTAELFLSPDGVRGYLLDASNHVLLLFNPATMQILPGGWRNSYAAALSDDGSLLYLAREDSVVALDAASLVERWRQEGLQAAQLKASGKNLAVLARGASLELVVFDGGSGKEIARAHPLGDYAQELTGAPDGGWTLRTGGSPERIVRYNAALQPVAEVASTSGAGFYYDAPRRRYLLAGYVSDAAQRAFTRLFDERLQEQGRIEFSSGRAPTLFAPWREGLLGFTRYDDSHITYYDAPTLQPTRRAILGVRLNAAALDEVERLLYVADNQEQIRVIDADSGRLAHTWRGSAPMALDTANRRIYVNRDGRVVALDTRDGTVLATFATGGAPAADPGRDLVYIAQRGVYLYDRQGQALGKFNSTFPSGQYSPNPFAYGVVLNPANGQLAVLLNNGIPGSNNGTFMRIYPPGQDLPKEVAAQGSHVTGVAPDAARGRMFASYGGWKGRDSLVSLDESGTVLAQLHGRQGAVAYDPVSDSLYVATGSALAQVDATALELKALYSLPQGIEGLILDSPRQELYLRDEDGSRLTVMALGALPPLVSTPGQAGPLPDTAVSQLFVAAGSEGNTLYAVSDQLLYRSPDGRAWQRLPVGSLPVFGQLTVVSPQLLFWAGSSQPGADGAWRSRDGGTTWELLSAGLKDLRARQAILALDAEHVLFPSNANGTFRWDPRASRWLPGSAPDPEFDLATLSMAPDGTLYQLGFRRMRRSRDFGATWEELPVPGEGGSIVGFVRREGRHSVFAMVGTAASQLLRSDDEGKTWRAVSKMPALPSYAGGFRLYQDAGTLYLYRGTYTESHLYRSLDGGESWERAASKSVSGTNAFAPGKDTLWFGMSSGGVRGLLATDISWSADSPGTLVRTPMPGRTAVPAGTPASKPTSTPTPVREAKPCPPDLPEDERALASEVPELGCPAQRPRQVQVARERFEDGQMFWLGDRQLIAVLESSGRYRQFADEWNETLPSSDPALRAPSGLYQPVRGFGKVWREKLGGPSSTVGWATEPERSVTAQLQQWEGGLRIWFDSSESYLLMAGGGWR